MHIIPVIILLLSSQVAYAGIGTVTDATSNGCKIERNKKNIPGDKGVIIESMDVYITGSCTSNITFKDDTKVKVTENSRLLIDDFVFDPKASDASKLALKVGMGTVRYASGQIAKNNPQQVNIKTPAATIAVRGTDFTMTVDESGQSLIVLVPSCKDEKDIKKYELAENTCKVGKIEVETLAGKVILDEAFQATFVQSATISPTPATSINIIESKITNNLIIVKPLEVQRVMKEVMKSPRDKELEELEAEAARRVANQVSKSGEEIEQARILAMMAAAGKLGCNAVTSICVAWDKNNDDIRDRGKGTAFRIAPFEHYSEIKTQGFNSNTTINIIQNSVSASTIIGDGSPGGNIVTITQNTGVIQIK
jgi:hypothetical protein